MIERVVSAVENITERTGEMISIYDLLIMVLKITAFIFDFNIEPVTPIEII